MTKESKSYQEGFIGIAIAIIGAIIAASAVTTVVLVKNENRVVKETEKISLQKVEQQRLDAVIATLNKFEVNSSTFKEEHNTTQPTIEKPTPVVEIKSAPTISNNSEKSEKTEEVKKPEIDNSSDYVIPPKPINCPYCKWNMEKWMWEMPNGLENFRSVPPSGSGLPEETTNTNQNIVEQGSQSQETKDVLPKPVVVITPRPLNSNNSSQVASFLIDYPYDENAQYFSKLTDNRLIIESLTFSINGSEDLDMENLRVYDGSRKIGLLPASGSVEPETTISIGPASLIIGLGTGKAIDVYAEILSTSQIGTYQSVTNLTGWSAYYWDNFSKIKVDFPGPVSSQDIVITNSTP